MRRRAYGATRVNDVDALRLTQGKEGLAVMVGTDVGKYKLLAVCRQNAETLKEQLDSVRLSDLAGARKESRAKVAARQG